ncbi:hypothetical protein B8W69_04780 [Mycobacterium vulneris]|uniref:6-phosphogluconate dehydrogenase NADP-binding domain-containing protein n=1 Tax=Mycolicibacterium vulneris TaxID=547163 RepID=A0A1X2LAZ7_9MYCO|nr:hypothetical protein B8W69_04780 [Mycolicibacterium vulneris]
MAIASAAEPGAAGRHHRGLAIASAAEPGAAGRHHRGQGRAMEIGFIGLGSMGFPMASRPIGEKHDVVASVHNSENGIIRKEEPDLSTGSQNARYQG